MMQKSNLPMRGNDGQRKRASTLDDEEVRAHLMKLREAYEKQQGVCGEPARARINKRAGNARRIPKGIITIRISQHVLAAFRATGKGWQARMDAALCEAVDNGQVGMQHAAEEQLDS